MYFTKQAVDPRFEAVRKKLDPNGLFAFEQALPSPDAEAFQDF